MGKKPKPQAPNPQPPEIFMAQDTSFLFDTEEEKIDLRSIAYRYIRNWYLFVIFLIMAFVGAFFYLLYTRPMYEVSSVVLIKDDKKGLGGNDFLKDLEMMGGNKIVENEMEVFKSRSLMKKVAESLRLNVIFTKNAQPIDADLYGKSPIWIQIEQMYEPVYKKKFVVKLVDRSKFELLMEDKIIGTYTFGQGISQPQLGRFRVFSNSIAFKGKEEINVQFANDDRIIQGNLGRLDVSLLNQKSTVLKLSYQETSPQRGKDVLKKLHEEYILASLGDKNTEVSNTLRFIDERLRLISTELTNVEKDVEVYKSAAGFTDISSESNLFLEKVKETDSKLNEVDIQVKVLEGVEKFLNTPGSNVSSVTSMINDPSLSLLTNKLSELELQREKYSRTVQAGNPLLETVNTQVANTKSAIRENINNQKKGLIISRTNLASLNRSIESSIRSIPKKEREFVSIKRQQGIKESLYLLLLQKKEETAISYASTVSDSRLIDEAFVSPAPIKPLPNIVYLIAFLIGLGVPIVLINIKVLLNNKISSRTELEQKTNGIPILGEVGDKPKNIEGPLLDTKSNNFIAEQFRILRTNLQYLIQGQKACKKILVTSSISGEGKSFISMNLAASLASAGQKVVLINLDIRKPKLHEYLKLSNNTGIVNYLIGQGKAADFVQTTTVENLSFVSSGPIPPNPAELLSSTKLREFIAELENDYQYILIDCSPNGLVTDAQLAAPLVDATVFIVRHEYTPQGSLLPLSSLYKEKKFPSLTVIYNGVKGSSSYGYGYGYGYGYYGESANPSIWKKLKGVFM